MSVTDTRDYLQACFGDATGWMIAAVGSDPRRSDSGRYEHQTWKEYPLRWPAEADRAVASILKHAATADVYVCPYLMRDQTRAKGNSALRELVHADVDHELDPAAVVALGGYAIASGTPGHVHVYVPLTHAVTRAQHELLCRGLAAYLGGDAKISDNDLLRPPGTTNHKNAAAVRWVVPCAAPQLGPVEKDDPHGRRLRGRVDPQVLAATLGADLAHAERERPPRPAEPDPQPVEPDPVDLDAHPAVAAALAENSGDRSADTMRIAGVCFDAGLSLAQARATIRTRPDLAARLDEMLARRAPVDDLANVWAKITTDREGLGFDAPVDGFWEQTAVLAHILAFARSRGASPYATLGAVLRRTLGAVRPHVVLPPTIGGAVSLNLFTCAVGASGHGKDIANAAGRDAVTFHRTIGGVTDPVDDAPYIHPGTGEGLARIFAGRGEQAGAARAHLQVPDVATLEALADRRGQSLVSQLLAAWMGQPLGFSNNSTATSTPVEAHAYRLCLGIGVQPDNAGFFLSREKDGLPQRFVWLPTGDPGMPRTRPDPVEPLAVELPDFSAHGEDSVVLDVPPAVSEEVWRSHWQVMTGAAGVDPLDKHTRLARLKVAAGIAVLHGDGKVTDQAWAIAGQLIEVSNQQRAGLRQAVAERRRRENTAKAHDQADREDILSERLTRAVQQRVARAITGKLKRAGTATRLDLRRACTSPIRGDFDPVFDVLLDEGVIVCCDDGGSTYRLGPSGA